MARLWQALRGVRWRAPRCAAAAGRLGLGGVGLALWHSSKSRQPSYPAPPAQLTICWSRDWPFCFCPEVADTSVMYVEKSTPACSSLPSPQGGDDNEPDNEAVMTMRR